MKIRQKWDFQCSFHSFRRSDFRSSDELKKHWFSMFFLVAFRRSDFRSSDLFPKKIKFNWKLHFQNKSCNTTIPCELYELGRCDVSVYESEKFFFGKMTSPKVCEDVIKKNKNSNSKTFFEKLNIIILFIFLNPLNSIE